MVQGSSSPPAEPELERPSQPARLQGPIDDVGAGKREVDATPSVKKRKNKVQRVNKRRGAARLYALAPRIDELQSDLATGAHLQRLGVVPSSSPPSDTSTSPSSASTTTTSSQTVQKGGAGRRINKVTVRQMLGWAHYRFRQRLQQQAELRGATVHVVSEAYTSKSCGRCGRLHHSLGGNHTFRCPHPPCDYRSERDAHGARNIMAMSVERYVGSVVVPVQHAGTGGRQRRQLQRGARAAAAPAAAARDGKEEKQQQPAVAAAEKGEEDELWFV